MKQPKLPKLVAVDWIDSSSSNGWIDMPNRDFRLNLKCSSVGYLVHEEKDRVRVSASIAFDNNGNADQFNNTITIPRVAIQRIRKVKL